MIDQVLIPERNAEHPLGDHALDAVLDLRLDPTVVKAGREPRHEADRPIGRAEQQRPRVRRDLAAIEGGHHLAALDHFIPEQIAATLCRHRGAPLRRDNSLSQKNYRRFRTPMHDFL